MTLQVISEMMILSFNFNLYDDPIFEIIKSSKDSQLWCSNIKIFPKVLAIQMLKLES